MSKYTDIIEQIESGGRYDLISKTGAIGSMQVLPSTLANPGYGITPFYVPIHIRQLIRDNGSGEAKNPILKNWLRANSYTLKQFGVQYYEAMLKATGNPVSAAAAYNQGLGTLQDVKGDYNNNNFPLEGRNYVDKFNKLLATEKDVNGSSDNIVDSVFGIVNDNVKGYINDISSSGDSDTVINGNGYLGDLLNSVKQLAIPAILLVGSMSGIIISINTITK